MIERLRRWWKNRRRPKYVVGERGPEWFTPEGGTVIPHDPYVEGLAQRTGKP
jgi:hypothetical protein